MAFGTSKGVQFIKGVLTLDLHYRKDPHPLTIIGSLSVEVTMYGEANWATASPIGLAV